MRKTWILNLVYLAFLVCFSIGGYYLGQVKGVVTPTSNTAISHDQSYKGKSIESENLESHPNLNESLSVPKTDQDSEKLKPLAPLAAAKNLLIEAAAITDLHAQAAAYREATKLLCEAGYYKEAWETILPEPGLNRTAQLGVFFSLVTIDFETCAKLMLALPDSVEKASALESYVAGHFKQFPEILENSSFKSIMEQLTASNPSAREEIIGASIVTAYDYATSEEDRENANQMARLFHSKGLLSDEQFSHMIARNFESRNPFEFWTWIKDSKMGITESQSNFPKQARMAIVDGMVNKDASKALSIFAESEGTSSAHDLFLGLKQWTGVNPSAANDWYVKNQASLSEAKLDSAARAFAGAALDAKEIEGARQWSSTIKDPKLRELVAQQINDLVKTK